MKCRAEVLTTYTLKIATALCDHRSDPPSPNLTGTVGTQAHRLSVQVPQPPERLPHL